MAEEKKKEIKEPSQFEDICSLTTFEGKSVEIWKDEDGIYVALDDITLRFTHEGFDQIAWILFHSALIANKEDAETINKAKGFLDEYKKDVEKAMAEATLCDECQAVVLENIPKGKLN